MSVNFSRTSISRRMPPFQYLSAMQKSTSGGRISKKRTAYKVHELDRVMDLRKKKAMILELKSIIQSQKKQSLNLRDLEKEVGFVKKWSFMGVIEKYPSIFHVESGDRKPPCVTFTEKAAVVAAEEADARKQMEPTLVRNLRKVLMLSVNCRVPFEKIELIQEELGLSKDFKKSLIPEYPQYFSLGKFGGTECLQLENWDSSLAVTFREENAASTGAFDHSDKRIDRWKGNGAFSFRMAFPSGFRPNRSYLDVIGKWQKMEFPSPYLNARRFELVDPEARKRVIAVVHEILNLTLEKRLTFPKLNAFHSEYLFPSKLLQYLVRHHGIFYITDKGLKNTVFLKEAYCGSNLTEKCPLLDFFDRFVALAGWNVPCK